MSRKTPASGKSPASPPDMTPEEAKKELGRRYVARELLRPSTLAGNTIDALKMTGLTDIQALTLALREQAALVTDKNDLSRAEGMLIAQAHTLDALFNRELMTALRQEALPQFEAHAKLAMRAQSQCRSTLETLAAIKNPPVLIAKQANIAAMQQVNNNGIPAQGDPSRTRESETRQTELLEHHHGDWLDTGTASTASGPDPEVETLGTVDGTKVRRR